MKKAVVKAFGLAGVKLVPAARHEAWVRQLHDVMTYALFPQLESRPKRFELMAQLLGTTPAEAMYLINYLAESLAAPGDVCEFGVAQGATSALIANEIRDSSRTLWLFDSFEGLPKPTEEDVLIDDIFSLGTMDQYEGTMATRVGEVKRRLAKLDFPSDRLKIVPGFIKPNEPVEPFPAQVCFAYVDFDLYDPIRAVLDLLRSRISVGGAILVDDYGYFSQGAQKAVDEFVSANKEFKMTLPPDFAGEFCILRRADD